MGLITATSEANDSRITRVWLVPIVAPFFAIASLIPGMDLKRLGLLLFRIIGAEYRDDDDGLWKAAWEQ